MEVVCKECGTTFTISEGEKQFYEEKGFALPKRCKACRNARKGQKNEKPNTKK